MAGYLAGLRSSGLYSEGKRVDGASLDVNALIYRQMHYRDFYGKTVQLEFIVPMYRTSLDLPGAPGKSSDVRYMGTMNSSCTVLP